MTALIGRFLQMIGLVILPVALMIGLFGDNVRLEVNLLFIGGVVFLIGWMLARRTD